MTTRHRLVLVALVCLPSLGLPGLARAEATTAMAAADATAAAAATATVAPSAGATASVALPDPDAAGPMEKGMRGHRKWAHRDDLKDLPPGGQAVAILVPISFFLFIFLIVAAAQLASFRKDRHRHETLRLMVEKGAQIPVELISPPQRQRRGSDLRKGLILVGLGLGLSLFLLIIHPPNMVRGTWSMGLIPALVGLGYLLVWHLESRKNGETNGQK
jgi:hypothetical protein